LCFYHSILYLNYYEIDATNSPNRLAEELARTKLQSDLNAVPPNMYSLGVTNQVGYYNVDSSLFVAEVNLLFDKLVWYYFS